jgi:hypothetical protein
VRVRARVRARASVFALKPAMQPCNGRRCAMKVDHVRNQAGPKGAPGVRGADARVRGTATYACACVCARVCRVCVCVAGVRGTAAGSMAQGPSGTACLSPRFSAPRFSPGTSHPALGRSSLPSLTADPSPQAVPSLDPAPRRGSSWRPGSQRPLIGGKFSGAER